MGDENLTGYLKKAFEYKNSEDYKKSIDYFYKALALDNNSIEILTELAFLYEKLNQNDRALSLYEQILAKDADNKFIKYSYALLLKHTKKYSKSEQILLDLYEQNYEINKIAKELFELLLLNSNYQKIIDLYNKRQNILVDSMLLYYVAMSFEKVGQVKLAEELYEKSYSKNIENIDAGVNIVSILIEKGMIENAEEFALRLLKYSEDDRIFALLGEINYLKSNLDVAMKYYSYAIRANSKNSIYYFKLGSIYSIKGFFEEAESSYCKALEIEPENVDYNYSLAYLYYTVKKYNLAEKVIDFILSFSKISLQALAMKSLLLLQNDNDVEAGKYIEEIIKSKENDDFAFYAVSLYYSKFNLWEKAAKYINKAIELNENSLEYKYTLANIYFNFSKFDKAFEMCSKIVAENSKYVDSYILMAKILLAFYEYERAVNFINKAIALDTNAHEAYSLLGCVYFDKSNYEKAVQNFKIAVSINPKEEKYYTSVASSYFMMGNYKEAYLYYKEASSINITNADYYYYMAKCSIYENDKENALANFSVMKRLSPTNINYIEEYADYLLFSGSKKKAISLLNSTIKLVKEKEEKEKLKKILEKIKKSC